MFTSEMVAQSFQSLFFMWLAVSLAGALIVASIDGAKLQVPGLVPQH